VKVLVNAASIKEGGPLVVLANLLSGMQRLDGTVEWILACGETERLRLDHNVETIDVRLDSGDPTRIVRWYELELPRAVETYKPDVLFSVTNYLSLRRSPCATVLLVQHAGHFCPEFLALDRKFARKPQERLAQRLKTAWVYRSLRVADRAVVQTAALADRIAAVGLRAREQIDVVPHGPGQVRHAGFRGSRHEGPWRIGYISKFGVQKNFETLFRAASLLSKSGHDIRVVLTLDPKYAPSAQVLRDAEAIGIGPLIENVGETSRDGIEAVYDGLDFMAFCSLCESFGFPMVEAMARGLPIVVADTPENREITGDAAERFSPLSYEELASCLRNLIVDKVARDRRSALSLERSRAFSWDRACGETLVVLKSATG
jgi:glycosyltransferase involved in cell wall biosynthesis